ncbi:PorP/SprF family type IX secretion system membrane protein [Pedobacter sp. UBA5917]|jgi:type IX secretion system PorP/SprF family membrane protein|uniref:PorP/SprF family type IX secretion system membrane protein n=1 Tax=Pedobacter sp. UBA5917 TaxID=1947061 RepID=UPI0025E6351A|nr:PorP/SprF family type IX secretion system membrane protein [Pedobacter sp. UBA5917]
MKHLLAVLVLASLGLKSFSQQATSYNHYYNHPFMYNPAFAGAENQGQVTAVSRMQWAGSDRAVTSAFVTAELPLKKNIAIGGRFYSDRQGLINNTAGLLTFAYHLPLNDHSRLSFGVSAGASRQGISTGNLNVSNPDDPTIGSAENNRSGFEGDFGLNYNYKSLNLGVALPSLFRSDRDNVNFGQQKGQVFLFSAAYKINTGFAEIVPQLIYRNKSEFQGRTQTMLTLYFKQNFWAGGLYRFSYGPAFYGGFKINSHFKAGYAYETSPDGQSTSIGATHEVFLSYQFAKKGQ